MTDDERDQIKLSTMNELSDVNNLLECLKRKIDGYRSLAENVSAVLRKAVSPDRASTSISLELPELDSWPSGHEIRGAVVELEKSQIRAGELKKSMRKWGVID